MKSNTKNEMAFKWKTPGLYKTSAQDAGEELNRISKSQSLTPESVLNESRPEDAVLHNEFEWDDFVAGELYRKKQAGDLIRNIVVVSVTKKEKSEAPVQVRAFIHTKDDYQPIQVVVNSPDYREEMLRTALNELKSFQNKYSALTELSELFDNMNLVINKFEDKDKAA